MRICIIAEGCYPYVVGGVSGWVHSIIQTFPKQEFILLTIIASRELSGKFAYELPENVTEVHELYLEDVDWGSVNKRHKTRLNQNEYHAIRSLLLNQEVEWEEIFDFFHILKDLVQIFLNVFRPLALIDYFLNVRFLNFHQLFFS